MAYTFVGIPATTCTISGYSNDTFNVAISCWVKPHVTATATVLQTINNNGYGLETYNTGKFTFAYRDTFGFIYLDSTINYVPDTWYHVVCTLKTTNVGGDGLGRMYINGVLDATSGTTTDTTTTNIDGYTVSDGDTTSFEGDIAELCVWNGATLSQNDITNLACGLRYMPLQIKPANIHVYFPMNEFKEGNTLSSTYWKELSTYKYSQIIVGAENSHYTTDSFFYQ